MTVPATPAVAVNCVNQDLTDAEGYHWLSTYYPSADAAADGISAMDPFFDPTYSTYYYANEAMRPNCSFEDGDRELRYPAMMIGDLEVSGTMFIPSGAPAFQRVLLLLRNPGSEPASLTTHVYDRSTFGNTNQLITSSSGDGRAPRPTTGSPCATAATSREPRVAFLWQFGTAADRRRPRTS